MKRKILTVLSIMVVAFQINHLKAQTTLFMDENGNPANTDLATEFNVSVGDQATPDARIHVFNGNSQQVAPESIFYSGTRPFLITGGYQVLHTLGNNTFYGPASHQNYFTVDQQGFVGINVLDPFTKFHLHDGAFTITDGEDIAEPSANWQIHGTANAFAIKDHLDQRYRFWINKSNGNVGIGTTSPSEKLEVEGNVLVNGDETVNGNNIVNGFLEVKNGGITNFKVKTDGFVRAREIKVDLQTIPDYVFKEGYKLMPLAELKTFIEINNHLPNVKSEAEFKEEGSISLNEMNMKLLEKVEELTLYILDLQEQVDELKIK